MCKKVIIIGAGGHGHVICDIVKKSGDIIVGYLDDAIVSPEVLGKVSDCVKYPDCYFIIAIGNNETRKNITERYPSLSYYTAIHPNAVIAEDAYIGEGTCIMANAVINPSSRIGKHCIINTAAIVDHDCNVKSYTHISTNAALCGTVTVGEKTHIGAGATVKNNVTICGECTVGIGAVVLHDIEKSGTYIGVPVHKLD